MTLHTRAAERPPIEDHDIDGLDLSPDQLVGLVVYGDASALTDDNYVEMSHR